MVGWLLPVLFGAALVVLLVRWSLRRVDSLGRATGFPWVSAVLLLAVAGGTAVPPTLRTIEQHRLGTVASALAGRPVAVHCQTLGGASFDAGAELGYVRWTDDGPADWTLIKRDQCRDLTAYLRSGGRDPSRARIVAVHVLSHEAMHLRGEFNEAKTECAALQRDAWTARMLGASPAGALDLARRYWREVYPHMPGDYRDGGCTAGGKLDERLSEAPWS
jgi:hypothetical protein